MTSFLNRGNMNINLSLRGDVEDKEYRYEVFPGYREWVSEVFRKFPGPKGSHNWEMRVSAFTKAKDKAIAIILAEREEATNKANNSVTNYEEAALALLALSKKQKDEVEALYAQVAELKAEITSQKNNNKSLQFSLNKAVEEVSRKDQEVSTLKRILKQTVLTKLFTREARTVAQSV